MKEESKSFKRIHLNGRFFKFISLYLIIFLIFMFSLNSNGYCATYYVDFTNSERKSADSNNGTSSSTALMHCPGDNRYTPSGPAPTTLSAGDTVIFKGGINYKGSINLNWSGSAGRVITYDGNSAGTWGRGKAVINNENDVSLTYGFATSAARSYITIKNFTFQDIGGYTDAELAGFTNTDCPLAARDGKGISIDDAGSNHITIQNSNFGEIGNWQNHAGMSVNSMGGAGVWLANVSNVTIDSSDFNGMKIGIGVKAKDGNTIQNVEIKNNSFHDYVVWGIDVSPNSSKGDTLQNILIHNNTFYNLNKYASGNWLGCGNPHSDGIFLRTAGLQNSTWTDVKIYGNTFYDNAGGTAEIYVSQGPSAIIYNNEFYGTGNVSRINVAYGIPTGTSPYPQVIRILNNSFLGSSRFIMVKDMIADEDISVYIENNIFKDTRIGIYSPAYVNIAIPNGGTIESLDYNQYYADKSGRNVVHINGYKTFSGIVALGYEGNGQFCDPEYESTTNLFIKATSPCKRKGKDQSAYFTTDKNGITRFPGAWGIGAYYYEISPPPSNLHLRSGGK